MTPLLTALLALAAIEETRTALPAHAETIWQALLYTILFGLTGILLTVLGFKVFDWIHPTMHVETELAKNHNMAVAIVMSAIILGISIVIAVAIHG